MKFLRLIRQSAAVILETRPGFTGVMNTNVDCVDGVPHAYTATAGGAGTARGGEDRALSSPARQLSRSKRTTADAPVREGNAYRVRLVVTAGTRPPIVVTSEPRDSHMHHNLRTIVLDGFKAARRQLESKVEQRRGREKSAGEPRALVVRLFPDEGNGFPKTLDGREIYFHHSVLHADFERFVVGTEVRFEQHEGDKGPQASSVQIVNKSVIRVPADGQAANKPPRGWQGAGAARLGRQRSKRGARR
jgi:cold shock CspA family protein